jgi:hypothetical protein
MVLAIDVVQIIDWVLENAVTNIAIEASSVGGSRSLVEHNLLIDLAFQINLKQQSDKPVSIS